MTQKSQTKRIKLGEYRERYSVTDPELAKALAQWNEGVKNLERKLKFKRSQPMQKPHVGGKRTANHKSISSVEKTPKAEIGSGLPRTYFGNSDACKSTDRKKK